MSRGRKITLIIASVLFVAAIVLSIVSSVRKSSNACITPADFKNFYGRQAYESEFHPKDSFFTNSYVFLSGSTDLNTDDSDSIAIDASNIAQFYLTHPNTPFSLTISAIYNEQASIPKTVAEDRNKVVQTALIKAGLPSSIITSQTIDNSNIETTVEDPQDTNLVTINMASISDCRE